MRAFGRWSIGHTACHNTVSIHTRTGGPGVTVTATRADSPVDQVESCTRCSFIADTIPTLGHLHDDSVQVNLDALEAVQALGLLPCGPVLYVA